jgi:hypothetical protein
MINSLGLSKLRNGEFINFGNDILGLSKKYDLPTLGLQTMVTAFEDSLTPLNKLFLKEKGSAFSTDIELADLRRDNAVLGIKFVLDGYLKHYEQAKQSAAELLIETIEKYGSGAIAYQNYVQETSSINQFIAEIDANPALKAGIEELNLTAWFGELNQANLDFNVLFIKRNEEQSQKPEGNLKDLRKSAKDGFDALANFLIAKQWIQPGPEQESLILEINGLISQYNLLVQSRMPSA